MDALYMLDWVLGLSLLVKRKELRRASLADPLGQNIVSTEALKMCCSHLCCFLEAGQALASPLQAGAFRPVSGQPPIIKS